MKKYRTITLLVFLLSTLLSANIFAADTSTNTNTSTVPGVTSPNTGSNANNTTTSTNFSPTQVKDIQKIVRDYLISNPDVLVEASQALRKQQATLAQKNAMAAIEKDKQQLFEDPKTPTAGNLNGSVYIVEFFDYQCGHCKTMSSIVQNVVKNNKNVKMIFKELPIFGGASRLAAEMALASVAQGKYYQFHDALFQAAGPLTPTLIDTVAKRVGLDVSKLKKAASAPWVKQQLRANFRLAQALRLVGTPAFIISNKQMTKFRFIPGATSQSDLKQQVSAVE